LTKTEFSQQIFDKHLNIKFQENPFSGSPVVPCGLTDRQTEMTKLIIAFRNFADASKNETRCCKQVYLSGTCKFTNTYTATCCEASEEQGLA